MAIHIIAQPYFVFKCCFSTPVFLTFSYPPCSPGSSLGRVCPELAEESGLPRETLVGASMIDAHAGALGMLACKDARSVSSVIDLHTMWFIRDTVKSDSQKGI